MLLAALKGVLLDLGMEFTSSSLSASLASTRHGDDSVELRFLAGLPPRSALRAALNVVVLDFAVE